jgi:putative transposase
LRHAHRSMSRKVKFSANWKKAKERVARLYEKAANRRKDCLHKLTTRLSKNHATVVVEDLKVLQMTKSAKGTVESPGKNVKQKSGLNKAILDQGWGELARQLAYKCEWSGGRFIKVPPHYTSQTCRVCDFAFAGNRLSQSEFVCLWCGHEEHADVNAAKNILALGQSVTACGGNAVGHPTKQELIRATG